MKPFMVSLFAIAFVCGLFCFVDTSEACGPAAFVGPSAVVGPVAALNLGVGRQVVRATPFRPFVGPVSKTFAPRGAAFLAPQAVIATQAFVVPQRLVVPQQFVLPQAVVQQVPTSQFSFSMGFSAPQAVVSPSGCANCQAFFR